MHVKTRVLQGGHRAWDALPAGTGVTSCRDARQPERAVLPEMPLPDVLRGAGEALRHPTQHFCGW